MVPAGRDRGLPALRIWSGVRAFGRTAGRTKPPSASCKHGLHSNT